MRNQVTRSDVISTPKDYPHQRAIMFPMDRSENQRDEKCGNCEQDFEENTAAIQCEGTCNRWFHKDCAGLKQGEFNIMCKNKCNLTWLCSGFKNVLQKTKHHEDLIRHLMAKTEDMTTNNSVIVELTQKVENLNKFPTR